MNKKAWEKAHSQPRFGPKYPHEFVVRWTFRNFPSTNAKETNLLDVGCGTGRHSIFFGREGYCVTAVDYSELGIQELEQRATQENIMISTAIASAVKLPFSNNFFDGVLCFGVLYYLTMQEIRSAVSEIFRVLKTGGKTFVVARSKQDSRCKYAKFLGDNLYKIIALNDSAPSNAEIGMNMTFLDIEDIEKLFQEFCDVIIDKATVTWNGGEFSDDDWLICATK